MSSWDEIIEQQLVQTGACYAAALANAPPDLAFYAAAPVANGEGWKHLWSEDHVQNVQVSEDRFEDVSISEAMILAKALMTGTAPNGVWLGKTKYKVVQRDPNFEIGDQRVVCLFVNRPRGGAHIVSTEKTVVVGLYNEDIGQTSGNCKRAVLRFVEYLVENGC
jgi:profilin-like protein